MYVKCNCMETHPGRWHSCILVVRSALYDVTLAHASAPPPPCPWYVISMWDCSSLHICQVVKKQCGAPFSTHNCPTPHLPCPHCVQTRALTTARGGRFQGFLGTPTLQQGGKSVFCVCEETCCAFIMFSFAP